MTTVTTLVAITSLILALAGSGDAELAKKKPQAQTTQTYYDKITQDNVVTADEYTMLH